MINKEFKTILDLVQVFPDEKSCHQYLAYQRWEGEMTCPHEGCENDRAYVYKDGIRYKCTKCKRNYTAKTGTFMEGSNLPTIKWLMAMYLVLQKKGISSIQLSKMIGTTQKTAWFVLQRIRWAFGNEEEKQLEGIISTDETFVGGRNKNRHADKKVKNSQGRSFKDKTPVLGVLQEQESYTIERPHKILADKTVIEKIVTKQSIVRCKAVKDTKASSIQPIIKQMVANGSMLISDEWHGYRGLNTLYNHQVVDHAKGRYQNDAGYSSNSIEGFWALAKRSIIGIYHKTTPKHLDKYFNEFTFRYNKRDLGMQAQIECIVSNMVCRLKYKDLVA